jgi:hypothetical protein
MAIPSDVLAKAVAEIGYKEEPPNSNHTKYGKWYGLDGMAWCAMFVSWCFDQAGLTLPQINNVKGFSGCQSAHHYWDERKRIIAKENVLPGDIVFFDWQGDKRFEHTGIFEKDNGDGHSFTTIEGNTAVGNDSNGGEVMRRTHRPYNRAVFVHPEVYDKNI